MARLHPDPGPKTRLFLVDDQPVVLRGLRLLFDVQPDLEVCGEAQTEQRAVEGILASQPDLAIVDLTLKEGDGLTLIERLQRLCPAQKVLVFSMHEEVHFATLAFAAGARGYVVKDDGAELVVEAVRVILEGGYYLSERIAAKTPGLRASAGPRHTTRPL